jgi:hypothetical protein
MFMGVPKSFDGDFSNLKNKRSSKKTRKVMLLNSIPESFPMKAEEPSTESSLST